MKTFAGLAVLLLLPLTALAQLAPKKSLAASDEKLDINAIVLLPMASRWSKSIAAA